jgi:hypothetical protein
MVIGVGHNKVLMSIVISTITVLHRSHKGIYSKKVIFSLFEILLRGPETSKMCLIVKMLQEIMMREGHPANEPHLSRSRKERQNLPLSDRASNKAYSL